MPRFAANLTLLFTELPFLDRFDAAAEAGFAAVEVLCMLLFDARFAAAAAATAALDGPLPLLKLPLMPPLLFLRAFSLEQAESSSMELLRL